MVEVVGILIAAGNGEHARAAECWSRCGSRAADPRIGDQSGKGGGDAHAALGCGQQQHPAVRGEATAIEGGGHFLASNGWD